MIRDHVRAGTARRRPVPWLGQALAELSGPSACAFARSDFGGRLAG